MTALVCGSLAYDNIMVYPGHFGDQILPDKVHALNVVFMVPELRREFGGCAGNIAYNLHLLGGDVLPMGTVGVDFDPYRIRLESLGISLAHIRRIEAEYTAQAYITTDLDNNQIIAFHPGAMNSAHIQSVPASGISLGMVSPDGRDGMINHAREFSLAGIPFIFDPGQGLPMFDGDELNAFIDQATWVAVNDYESSLLVERTGSSLDDIASRVEALIVTRGAKGSEIRVGGDLIEIPVVEADVVVDPTGCGDAYRAGLLYGLQRDCEWTLSGHIASLAGSLKIAAAGTQNHTFTPDEFFEKFHARYGYYAF